MQPHFTDRRLRAAAWTILWLAIFAGAAAGAGRGQTSEREAELRRIELRLPSVRHLGFKKPVQFEIETPDQARQFARREMHKHLTDEELRHLSVAGAMMALWPAGYDPTIEGIGAESRELLGYYDPAAKRMVLVQGAEAAASRVVIAGAAPSYDYLEEMTLAHELTHALQDQYFDLSSLERIKHEDDRQLAFRAVVEGDATLAGVKYTFSDLNSPQAREALSQVIMRSIPSREMVSVPETLTIQGAFVYGAGTKFVAFALKRGGWKAVDQLFRDPPLSTQQVLNPKLYFDHSDPPRKVDISGYERALPDWHKVEENTLGEVGLLGMLHENLGDAEDWTPIGSAWSGDRYLVLSKGRALTIIGFITFSDRAAANHFADTYGKILDRKDGERIPHAVEVRGNTVLTLIGESATQAKSITALWATTDRSTARQQAARRAAKLSVAN